MVLLFIVCPPRYIRQTHLHDINVILQSFCDFCNIILFDGQSWFYEFVSHITHVRKFVTLVTKSSINHIQNHFKINQNLCIFI